MVLNVYMFWILIVIGLALVVKPSWKIFFKILDTFGFSTKVKGLFFKLGIAEPLARIIGAIILILTLWNGWFYIASICKVLTICN